MSTESPNLESTVNNPQAHVRTGAGGAICDRLQRPRDKHYHALTAILLVLLACSSAFVLLYLDTDGNTGAARMSLQVRP